MKRLKSVSVVIALVLLASLPVLAQRGRGGRGAPPPPPQAMQDVANSIVEFVNNQDADGLTGMTADGAVYLDEDGHALPATFWIGIITSGDSPKQLAISGMRGDVWNDTGWVSFNYELDEQYEGQPVTLTGTASVVLQQVDGNWMIRMFHGALEQTVPALVAGQE